MIYLLEQTVRIAIQKWGTVFLRKDNNREIMIMKEKIIIKDY